MAKKSKERIAKQADTSADAERELTQEELILKGRRMMDARIRENAIMQMKARKALGICGLTYQPNESRLSKRS